MVRKGLLLVGCLLTFALLRPCHADGLSRDEQMQLLEDEIDKAVALSRRARSRDPYHGLPFRIERRERRGFVPIEGLDSLEAVPFLMEVVKDGPVQSKLSGSKYEDLARCYAALALSAIDDPRALEPLAEALKGRIVEDRKRPIWLPAVAAQSLAFLGDYRAVEPLIEAMNHEDAPVRAAAAGALSMLLEKPIDALAAAMRDPKMRWTPRDIWGRLLGRCLDVYEEELRHGDPRRRALAASSLAIYLKEPLKRLKSAESSADQQVREAAQKALAEMRAIVGPAEKEPEAE